MSSSTKKTPSKKRLMITILAITTSVFLLTAFLSVGPAVFVNAIMQNHTMMVIWGPGKTMSNNSSAMNGMYQSNIPSINGTINLKNITNNASIENKTVPFLTAAQSAQNSISNGKIIDGHVGITQGFLTYSFLMSNPTNNTLSKVIVDAGNGKVLYTSPGLSINSIQNAMKGFNGMNNGFGHPGGFGHWGGFNHQNNRGW
jgi:hypothetical protein